jgi:hypothetical protein
MNQSTKRRIREAPLIGALLGPILRTRTAFAYFKTPIWHLVVWVMASKEDSNFTYDLTPLNKHHMALLIAHITRKPVEEISGYIAEAEGDEALRQHIGQFLGTTSPVGAKEEPAPFGRRLGWYAIVRARKPRLVIETGVDKGLGSCVIAAALRRNSLEGYSGYYRGTDINPEAGVMFQGDYQSHGEIMIGDSIKSLGRIAGPIDLFINDSDHSAEYERREYQAIRGKLSPEAFILGDNSHATLELPKFARDTGREFVFFREQPKNHWYPGAGIGIAFSHDATEELGCRSASPRPS